MIVDYFSGDPVTAYLLAALTTWLFHSSIAAVLLLVTLAGRGFIPPELGIVLVLGVNLGSSIIAPLLTRRAEPAVRVVPIGNLLMRGVGSLVLLIAFLWAEAAARPPRRHGRPIRSSTRTSLFNCLVLLAGLPLAGRSTACPRGSSRSAPRPSRPTPGRGRAQRARRKGARHALAGARQRDARGRARLRDRRDHAEAHHSSSMRSRRDGQDQGARRARRPRRPPTRGDQALSGQGHDPAAQRGRGPALRRN